MLENILNLSSEQKRHIENESGPLHSVTEFVSEFLELTKKVPKQLSSFSPGAAKVLGKDPAVFERRRYLASARPIECVSGRARSKSENDLGKSLKRGDL
jgi:hypothetical protein